jgi:hypothetical protein
MFCCLLVTSLVALHWTILSWLISALLKGFQAEEAYTSDFDYWTTACITSKKKTTSRDHLAVLLLFRVIQNPRGDVTIMDLQLPEQSVPITTKVVSLNPAHGKVYSIQHYVIKVCHWLAAGQRFSLDTTVSSTNKTNHHDVIEILLKVALNTISLAQNPRWPP